jgi:hypothetical protein
LIFLVHSLLRPRCCPCSLYFIQLFFLPDSSWSGLCCVLCYDLFFITSSFLAANGLWWFTSNPVRNHWAPKQTHSLPFTIKPHNNLVIWCTFMLELFSHKMMKWIIYSVRGKILWNDCLNFKMEKILSGIRQSGFIGLGVDPIYIEMISPKKRR